MLFQWALTVVVKWGGKPEKILKSAELVLSQIQRGAYEVRKRWYQPNGQAKRNRLRRVLGSGRMVVSSSQMRRMRSHRLLR